MSPPQTLSEARGREESGSDDKSPLWEVIKQDVYQKYIVENARLSEVREYIDKKHRFCPSLPAYKRQLHLWKFEKYTSSDEMDHIVRALMKTHREELLQRGPDQDLEVDGNKVKLSQVKRHMRKKNLVKSGSTSGEEPSRQNSDYWLGSLPRQSSPSPLPGSPGLPQPDVSKAETEELSMHKAEAVENQPYTDYYADLVGSPAAMPEKTRGSVRSNEGMDEFYLDEQQTKRRRTESLKVDDRMLACPFTKRYPARFSEKNSLEPQYRKCSTATIQSISRLKQHLYRVHTCPEYYCSRCYRTMPKKEHLDEHVQKPDQCQMGDNPFLGRVTHDQIAAIKKRANNHSRWETWFAIFHTLFPGAPLPRSPYVDEADTNTINDFVSFFEANGEPWLAQIFKSKVSRLAALQPSQQEIVMKTFQAATTEFKSDLQPLYERYKAASNIKSEPTLSISMPEIEGSLTLPGERTGAQSNQSATSQWGVTEDIVKQFQALRDFTFGSDIEHVSEAYGIRPSDQPFFYSSDAFDSWRPPAT